MEQQGTLTLHRARQGFVAARTAQSNQLRGLLSEFGIVMPKGISSLKRQMPEILEDAENGLPHASRELFARLYAHFKELDGQVAELEQQIKACHVDEPRQPTSGGDSGDRTTQARARWRLVSGMRRRSEMADSWPPGLASFHASTPAATRNSILRDQ